MTEPRLRYASLAAVVGKVSWGKGEQGEGLKLPRASNVRVSSQPASATNLSEPGKTSVESSCELPSVSRMVGPNCRWTCVWT